MKIPLGPVELVICVFRHPFELMISYGPRTPDEPIKGFDLAEQHCLTCWCKDDEQCWDVGCNCAECYPGGCQ